MRINFVPWPKLNHVARASQEHLSSPPFGFAACPFVAVRPTLANSAAKNCRTAVVINSYEDECSGGTGSDGKDGNGSNNIVKVNLGRVYSSSSAAPAAYAKHLNQLVNFEGIVIAELFASDTSSYRYVQGHAVCRRRG